MGLFGGRKRARPWEDLEGFELPRFSATTLQVLEALRCEEGDADTVAEVIERDPGLSVRVLGMVNSAAFGARSEVTGLAHAVQLVGRSALERLVISLAVGRRFRERFPGGPGMQRPGMRRPGMGRPGEDRPRCWRDRQAPELPEEEPRPESPEQNNAGDPRSWTPLP